MSEATRGGSRIANTTPSQMQIGATISANPLCLIALNIRSPLSFPRARIGVSDY